MFCLFISTSNCQFTVQLKYGSFRNVIAYFHETHETKIMISISKCLSGVKINFFNNLLVGQVISVVYCLKKFQLAEEKLGTISFRQFKFSFGKNM